MCVYCTVSLYILFYVFLPLEPVYSMYYNYASKQPVLSKFLKNAVAVWKYCKFLRTWNKKLADKEERRTYCNSPLFGINMHN